MEKNENENERIKKLLTINKVETEELVERCSNSTTTGEEM